MAARKMLGVRVSEAGHEAIDQIINQTGAKQAVVVRTLLSEALSNQTVRDRVLTKLLAMRETL